MFLKPLNERPVHLSAGDWDDDYDEGENGDAMMSARFDAKAEEGVGPLSLPEFTDIFLELDDQPAWRSQADREMEYVDGNQLSADIIRRQREIGMPPAIEPLIGPAIDAVLGLETKNRADWRVTPNSDVTGDDLAKAMGFELNQAERKAKADRACSEAYRTQICVGVGWVEVSRNPNPFEYPYRCQTVHRNEIWWDWLAKEPDLKDARYLVRRRWTAVQQVKLMFPDAKDLIANCMGGWSGYDPMSGLDGGTSTDLTTGQWSGDGMRTSFSNQLGWSIEEMQWRDSIGKRVCLFEVWYRRWSRVKIIKSPDGRVVEYDPGNAMHVIGIASGQLQAEEAIVPKMRCGIWMGPHCLKDEPTPYKHQKFPYVPFWGKREDRTMRPYALVRGMMYAQDNVNATNSKLRWGLAAVRTTRTTGAVDMTDNKLRQEVARPDADIKLNAQHMATPGAVFKVERDFELTQQQFQLLTDSRASIQRTSGITPALQGSTGTATSGVQESQQTEQGTQALADLNDNFNEARAEVGELLLSLIIEDMAGKPKTVVVKHMGLKPDQPVNINVPAQDPATGVQYLDNDIERAMLKVEINDVPSTSSYRAQQLSAMSEAFKSMPPQFQAVAMPYLVALMDLPTDTREDIIKAVRDAAQQESPEAIEQRIAKAVADSRTADMRDLKVHELMAKYNPEKVQAEITAIVAKAFETNVNALYASNQTAAAITMNPAIAPVADSVAMLAGYQTPTPAGMDPNFPQPASAAAGQVTPEAQAAEHVRLNPTASGAGAPAGGEANTDPVFPPHPAQPQSALQGPGAGSETLRTSDNMPTQPPGQ
jgi:hypothetical protein